MCRHSQWDLCFSSVSFCCLLFSCQSLCIWVSSSFLSVSVSRRPLRLLVSVLPSWSFVSRMAPVSSTSAILQLPSCFVLLYESLIWLISSGTDDTFSWSHTGGTIRTNWVIHNGQGVGRQNTCITYCLNCQNLASWLQKAGAQEFPLNSEAKSTKTLIKLAVISCSFHLYPEGSAAAQREAKHCQQSMAHQFWSLTRQLPIF